MQRRVLDKGWVELIDVLGSDARVVAAARISYDNETKGEEADKKLINYLVSHGHWSPFEMPHLTFRMKAPIFVLRQLMRHRMVNWNEVSLRYTEVPDEDEYYTPDIWRGQDVFNKQSGSGEINEYAVRSVSLQYHYAVEVALKSYRELLSHGVAREQARMVLPVAMYSKVMFTVDLRNLINILDQRLHEGAQWETQQYARELKRLAMDKFPWTFEAYEKVRS